MADEPNLDIDDQAAVEAELRRLKESEQKPPTPPEGTETGIPPVDQPLTEPKPAEPVEAKPEDEARRKAEETWKELKNSLRDARRKNDELERQIREVREAQTKPKEAEPTKEPTVDENPVDYFQRRDQQREQEIRQLQQRIEQKDAQDRAEQQEIRFAQQHPDYMDARNFLEKQVEEEWSESGLAALHVSQLRDAVRRGRAGEPQFKMYAEHVDKWSQAEAVQKAADEQNREPEDVAIWKVARDTYIQQEYVKEQQAAAAAQRTIAENIYRRAQRTGWKPQAPANGQKPAETGDAARQRVLNSQKVAEAANSLSEAGNTSDVEGKRLIKSRQDVLNMDDEALDALIASGRWKEL